MSSLFFELPAELALAVVRDWLGEEKDLSALDVATCCRQHRMAVIELMRHHQLSGLARQAVSDQYHLNHLQWMSMRSVQFVRMDLFAKLVDVIATHSFHFPHVRTLVFYEKRVPLHEVPLFSVEGFVKILALAPNLEELDFQCALAQGHIDALAACRVPALKALSFVSWVEGDAIFSIHELLAAYAPTLQSLHLSFMMVISPDALAALMSCKHLQHLATPMVSNEDQAIDPMITLCTALPCLSSLKLMDSPVRYVDSKSVLALMEHLPELSKLSVKGCFHLKTRPLIKVFHLLPALTLFETSDWVYARDLEDEEEWALGRINKLKIHESLKERTKILALLASCAAPLQSLDLGDHLLHAWDIKDNVADRFASHLLSLRLNFAPSVPDPQLSGMEKENLTLSLVYLFEKARKLQRLELVGAKTATDDILFALSRYCEDLQFLSLHDLNLITDGGMEHVVGLCEKLVFLSLVGCPLLTAKTLCLVAVCSVRLQTFRLYACRKISMEGLVHVFRLFKQPIELVLSKKNELWMILRMRCMGRFGMEWLRRMAFE